MSRFANLEFNDESKGRSQQTPVNTDADRHSAEAQTAFERADFEQALRSYSRVLEHNPQHVPAWTGQVRALIELGEFQEARLWADKALERFPSDPELLAAKGVALSRCGDLDDALTFSDASIAERGDTPYVWLARGDVLLARGEKRADYCFDKALGLAAADWFIAWLAARIRVFYKQFTLALKFAQQALELKPDNEVLWLCAGRCQKELGLIGPARNSFQQALQLHPRWHEAERAMSSLAETTMVQRLGGWWRRQTKN